MPGPYAQDSIMQFQRTMDRAALPEQGWWYYAGTRMDRTRPWCSKHVGGVYSEDEVSGWNNDNWAGKAPVDVHITCGGYNCRHRLYLFQRTGDGSRDC